MEIVWRWGERGERDGMGKEEFRGKKVSGDRRKGKRERQERYKD
jgi:hypothetical protein